MVMGVDPAKMAQMQEVSQFINAVVTIDYKENTLNIVFSSDNPAAKELIPQLLDQFGNALATQLSSFFAIKGEIIEKGKE